MTTTLTVRLDEKVKRELDERARLRRKSVSALVREILDEAVAERPLGERIGHLAGRLELSEAPEDDWARTIREHNWRQ